MACVDIDVQLASVVTPAAKQSAEVRLDDAAVHSDGSVDDLGDLEVGGG
jgi:hypothetical protein